MALKTKSVWESYHQELYFFILKRVKEEEAAKEILQNSFIKIHLNLPGLKEEKKVRAWSYQIVRNEIINFHNKTSKAEVASPLPGFDLGTELKNDSYCCFDKFLEKLPEKYNSVVHQVFVKGKTQSEAARELGISLANAKARIRRAKQILKANFTDCCKYELNSEGILIGEPDCSTCN